VKKNERRAAGFPDTVQISASDPFQEKTAARVWQIWQLLTVVSVG